MQDVSRDDEKKLTCSGTDYQPSLKCRSPGCQQQGLTSKDGYCNNCSTKNRNPPAPKTANEPSWGQKCHRCKEFFGNEKFGGLCSACFNESTITGSQQKLQFYQPQHVQSTTVCKCKVCKEFHGDARYGGLCSVCFKKKYNAKPLQQPLYDFRQNQRQEPFHQPAPQAPQHQQPVYNQGLPAASPQPQPNAFGFVRCMTRGCARLADDQCNGYCVQCFENRITQQHQQSIQNQQRLVRQRDQLWQQDEYARRQEAEKERVEQERVRRQENRRMEQRHEETMRQQQKTDDQQQKPFTASNIYGLCENIQCADFAAPNCNGYCLDCYNSHKQPLDSATSHDQPTSSPTQ